MSLLNIYKPGQGKYVRSLTFVGALLIIVAGGYVLSDRLAAQGPYVRYGIPALVVVVLGLIAFWMVNRARNADFLISTESEMKKVSWSNRKEVIGSTKIVIITTVILAVLLFAVDIFFIWLFGELKIRG